MAKKFNIPSKRKIKEWVDIYKEFGKEGLMRSRKESCKIKWPQRSASTYWAVLKKRLKNEGQMSCLQIVSNWNWNLLRTENTIISERNYK